MRFYISGPMTGVTDYNRPAFNAIEEALHAMGFDVFNPARWPDGWTWHEHMRADIAELVKCDTLMLLPGWENSRGACIELDIAEALDMRIGIAERASAPGETMWSIPLWPLAPSVARAMEPLQPPDWNTGSVRVMSS